MYNKQQELFEVAFKKTKPSSDGQKVYQYLVYKVFFDAISSAYPLFCELVDKTSFEEVVCDFMKFGARNHKMWQMPNEFRKYVKKFHKFRDIEYVNELLWFEWIDVELMMKNYKAFEEKEFSYENEYKLNINSVIKKLKYRVFEKGNFSVKGEFYLLAYYNKQEYRVLYREISEVMYLFLKELKKNGSNKAVNMLAKVTEQNEKDVKEFLKDSLSELAKESIIRI